MTKPWLRSLICFSRAGKACTVSLCCVLHRAKLHCALQMYIIACTVSQCCVLHRVHSAHCKYILIDLAARSVHQCHHWQLGQPKLLTKVELAIVIVITISLLSFLFSLFLTWRWERGELLFCLWSDTQQSSCPLIRWGRFWGECKIVWQIQINKFKNKTNYRKSITKSIT